MDEVDEGTNEKKGNGAARCSLFVWGGGGLAI
jgi:hypothetical protein